MSGSAEDWSAALLAWANGRPDIKALVQIGSRVKPGAVFDEWSDFDYHIISSRPGRYRDGRFCRELGPCWSFGREVTFGNVLKVTAVYDGALEADFIVLRELDLRIAFLALRFPTSQRYWPRPLRLGVSDLRGVAGPGWKVLKGGAPWVKRYSRITPNPETLSEAEFDALCNEFWTNLVWASKKAARGEFRACQRSIHRYLIENSLKVFREEALLEGRPCDQRARRAESWFTPAQIEATRAGSRPERAELIAAITQIAAAFSASCAAVASKRQWAVRDFAEVRAWMAELFGSPRGSG